MTTNRLRLPKGMTAEKLRSIVAYMELFDVMVEKINFHQGGVKVDVAPLMKGKEVQTDLIAWADEIEGAKLQPHDWALTLADLLEGGLPERERQGIAVIGDVVYWSDESKGQRWSAIVDCVSDRA